MTFLLDTTLLIRFFQKRQDAIELLKELQPKGNLAISILSVAELRAGWTDKQAAQLLPNLYKLVKVESVTKEIAELSGQLRQMYRPKGKTLHTVDTIIAATSIVQGYYLVTFDKDFYPITEVELYNLYETHS